jgi:hypothetical protein
MVEGISSGLIENGSFQRHGERADQVQSGDTASETYPLLTKKGVEVLRDQARTNFLERIKQAPEGAIFFIGGQSDQKRTGQTAEVIGDELQRVQREQALDDLLVLTKRDITKMSEVSRGNVDAMSTVKRVRDLIAENSDRKIVVDYPLMLKQLTYGFEQRWSTDAAGKTTTDFFDALKKANRDQGDAVREWVAGNGKVERSGVVIQGPEPKKVAIEYLEGLSRLHNFVKTQFPDRPVMVHAVGHQWDLDVVATYLAKGDITSEGFEEVSGGASSGSGIDTAELVSDITVDSSGHATVTYRGKQYETDLVRYESTAQ